MNIFIKRQPFWSKDLTGVFPSVYSREVEEGWYPWWKSSGFFAPTKVYVYDSYIHVNSGPDKILLVKYNDQISFN